MSITVNPATRSRVVSRICEDYGHSPETADRIFNETLKFLIASGLFPEETFVPSHMVDQGWHSFLLFTREYAQFCRDNIGTYVHHNPSDSEELNSSSDTTHDLLKRAGFATDKELWAQASEKCCDRCDSVIPAENDTVFALA